LIDSSESKDGGDSNSGGGHDGDSAILEDLEFVVEISVAVGDLVLESAHTAGVVHDETISVLSGDRVDRVTSTVAVLCEISGGSITTCEASVGVERPIDKGDVGTQPSDTGVREGEDIASGCGVNNVLITGEEVDVTAGSRVTTTFAVPALVIGGDVGSLS